jgi:tRNA A-37 threonylcarbamoyl transferase component Bud32
MKICSILRCAPHLSLFLGFNLIVYDDSVMFGMGMCRPIDRLDRQMINQLKRNIKTMHKCRIIHFDVKPENLMYSPYL